MKELNVGIGIVTCGIRKLDERILKYNPVIFEDKERKGAAYCRNMLIKQFYKEGKKYIFIFDDDCVPVIDGWIDKLIDWMQPPMSTIWLDLIQKMLFLLELLEVLA